VHYNSRDDQKQGPSREGIRDRLGLATYRLEREDRNPKGTVSSFAVRFIGRYFILFFWTCNFILFCDHGLSVSSSYTAPLHVTAAKLYVHN
jgi:hypothetical protein